MSNASAKSVVPAYIRRSGFFGVLLCLFCISGFFYWLNYFNVGYLIVETSLQRRGTQQIFFNDGSGFNEKLSHREFVDEPYEYFSYRIDLSDLPEFDVIRLDPADTEGWVKFRRFEIKRKGALRSTPLIRQDALIRGIREFSYDPQEKTWVVAAEYGDTDPFIILNEVPRSLIGNSLVYQQVLFLCLVFLASIVTSLLIVWGFKNRLLSCFGFKMLNASFAVLERWFVKWPVAIVGLVLLIMLILRMLPDEPDEMMRVQFRWSGYSPEFIQLDYDTGAGFKFDQSRLFYNKDLLNHMDVNFRVPGSIIHKIRLIVPSGPCVGKISHFKLWKTSEVPDPQNIDLSHWCLLDGGRIHEFTKESLLFQSISRADLLFESKVIEDSVFD